MPQNFKILTNKGYISIKEARRLDKIFMVYGATSADPYRSLHIYGKLKKYTCVLLKSLLKLNGAKQSGNKDVLVQRMKHILDQRVSAETTQQNQRIEFLAWPLYANNAEIVFSLVQKYVKLKISSSMHKKIQQSNYSGIEIMHMADGVCNIYTYIYIIYIFYYANMRRILIYIN